MNAGSNDRKFVTANYLRKAAEDLKQIKERSYQLMQLKANSQVLDVGARAEGQIVGIDSDPNMVMKANLEVEKRQIAKRIKHIQSDAQRLPFSDSQFDGVHAERLFQVLPKSNAEPVFAEMPRVLKHNGRIVLFDADWGSARRIGDLQGQDTVIMTIGGGLNPLNAQDIMKQIVQDANGHVIETVIIFRGGNFTDKASQAASKIMT